MSLGHRSRARKTFYQASWDQECPDGRVFDSMLEASVARDLDILYKAKKIKAVKAQVWFDLKGLNGVVVCRHRPDFLITCNNGVQKIIEAKGEEAADWKIKKKLFQDNYPDIEYIVATRENLNYGKVIDSPRTSRPLPSNTFAQDVREMERQFTKKI
jgi:hypothetical protein